MKVLAPGLGLNELALTLSLGFRTPLGGSFFALDVVACGLLPLNAGIAGMLMWMRGFPEALTFAFTGAGAWGVPFPEPVLDAVLPTTGLASPLGFRSGMTRFFMEAFISGVILEVGLTLGTGEGVPDPVGGEATPIVRAPEELASLTDFSLISRCLFASLARIGTRSSGMGLLSWRGS